MTDDTPTPRTDIIPDNPETIPADASMTEREFLALARIRSTGTPQHWHKRGLGPRRYRISRREVRYSRHEVSTWFLLGGSAYRAGDVTTEEVLRRAWGDSMKPSTTKAAKTAA